MPHGAHVLLAAPPRPHARHDPGRRRGPASQGTPPPPPLRPLGKRPAHHLPRPCRVLSCPVLSLSCSCRRRCWPRCCRCSARTSWRSSSSAPANRCAEPSSSPPDCCTPPYRPTTRLLRTRLHVQVRGGSPYREPCPSLSPSPTPDSRLRGGHRLWAQVPPGVRSQGGGGRQTGPRPQSGCGPYQSGGCAMSRPPGYCQGRWLVISGSSYAGWAKHSASVLSHHGLSCGREIGAGRRAYKP